MVVNKNGLRFWGVNGFGDQILINRQLAAPEVIGAPPVAINNPAALANGLIPIAHYDLGNGSQLFKYTSPGGKTVWATSEGEAAAVGNQTIAALKTNTIISSFVECSYSEGDNYGRIENLPVPKGIGYFHLLLNHNGGQYLYTGDEGANAFTRDRYGLPGVASDNPYPYHSNDSIYNVGATRNFNVAGQIEKSTFTTKAALQAYIDSHPPGSVEVKDNSTSTTTNYPQNPVSVDDYNNNLKALGWEIKNTIEDWADIPGAAAILKDSPEYLKYANNPKYQFIKTGTQEVTVSAAIPGAKFNDQTQAQIDALRIKYPGLTFVRDGNFPGGEKVTAYPDNTNPNNKIKKGSDLYNQLLAEGWELKATGAYDTATTTTVLQNKAGLTLDEFNALAGEGWVKTATGKTKTVVVSPEVPEKTFSNLTKQQLDDLIAGGLYPKLTSTAKEISKDTIIPNGTLYNNGAKIIVGSDEYKKLVAEKKWNFFPADPLKTTTTNVVATQKRLTKDAADALIAKNDGWAIKKTYSKKVTTPGHTATTVSLKGLNEADLAKYKELPGYKLVKTNTISHSGADVKQSVCNEAAGILAGLVDSDDADKKTSVNEVSSEYISPKNKISNNDIFAKPGNANSDKVVDGVKANDDYDQFYVAGDPHFGGVDGNYAVTSHNPATGVYNMLEAGDAFTGNTFSLNTQVDVINNDGNVAHTKYGGAVCVDNKEYKFLVEGGKTEVTYPDGTKKTINPGDKFKLPENSATPVFEIKEVVGKGAGKNGADEKRMGIYYNEAPSKAVIDELVAKGAKREDVSKPVVHEIELGFREVSKDGAYISESSGVAGEKRVYSKNYPANAAEGVKNYYDLNYVRKEPSIVVTVPGGSCDMYTYDIEYTKEEPCGTTATVDYYDLEQLKTTEICQDQVTAATDKVVTEKTTLYDAVSPKQPAVTKEEALYDAQQIKKTEVKTELYSATKTETTPGEPKFDACSPDIPKVTKQVDIGNIQEKKLSYNLNKVIKNELYEACYQVEGISGTFYGGSTSPLAIDLNGDGVQTQDKAWQFDLDADGKIDRMSASLSDADGYLAWDNDGDGVVKDGTELFGNHTGGQNYSDGLAALTDYAESHLAGSTADHKLSLAEIQQLENTADLRIQITDANGNKVLKKPSELGITELQLTPDETKQNFVDERGVYHGPRTNVLLNGQEANMDDLWFSLNDPAAAVDDLSTSVVDNVAKESPAPPPVNNGAYYNYNANWAAANYNYPNYGANLPQGAQNHINRNQQRLAPYAQNNYGYQQQQIQQQMAQQQAMMELMMPLFMQLFTQMMMPNYSAQGMANNPPQGNYAPNPFQFGSGIPNYFS